ncbi:MAG: hypothetical protein ABI068_12605 [Ktedonobacterales bacterium]
MAKTAKPALASAQATTQARMAPDAPARPMRTGGSHWLRNAIIIFLLFCLMGIIPLALAGETLGGWRLPLRVAPLLAPGSGAPATIFDTPLAHPATMEVGVAAHILSQPAGGASLAVLQPGFGISVTQYAHTGATRWAHVSWSGPSHTSGGGGWTLASALQTPTRGLTSSIGDLGALSPDLNQRLASYGDHLVAVVYFPAAHALYLTMNANTSAPSPIGGGFRAILLADLYAQAEKPGAKPVPASLARGVAMGDPIDASAAYQQLGDAVGVSNYLLAANLSGIIPAAGEWQGAVAAPKALLMFYSRLFAGGTSGLVSSADQATIQQLLAHANATANASIIRPDALGNGGALVIDTGKSANAGSSSGSSGGQGVWASASGLLTPANGPQAVVVVFGRNESSTSAALSVLANFCGQLAIVLAG